MATTPTNNAVPSESPRDLKFNAGKIDEFVTSLDKKYTDRLGNEHYTIAGLTEAATSAGPTIEAAVNALTQANLAREAAEEAKASAESAASEAAAEVVAGINNQVEVASAAASVAVGAASTATSEASRAEAAAENAQLSAANKYTFGTHAELLLVTGVSGQAAFVFNDAGTHTDPVSGDTVPNNGMYTWNVTSTAWEWRSADVLSQKADKADLIDVRVVTDRVENSFDKSRVTVAERATTGSYNSGDGHFSWTSGAQAGLDVPVNTIVSSITSQIRLSPVVAKVRLRVWERPTATANTPPGAGASDVLKVDITKTPSVLAIPTDGSLNPAEFEIPALIIASGKTYLFQHNYYDASDENASGGFGFTTGATGWTNERRGFFDNGSVVANPEAALSFLLSDIVYVTPGVSELTQAVSKNTTDIEYLSSKLGRSFDTEYSTVAERATTGAYWRSSDGHYAWTFGAHCQSNGDIQIGDEISWVSIDAQLISTLSKVRCRFWSRPTEAATLSTYPGNGASDVLLFNQTLSIAQLNVIAQAGEPQNIRFSIPTMIASDGVTYLAEFWFYSESGGNVGAGITRNYLGASFDQTQRGWFRGGSALTGTNAVSWKMGNEAFVSGAAGEVDTRDRLDDVEISASASSVYVSGKLQRNDSFTLFSGSVNLVTPSTGDETNEAVTLTSRTSSFPPINYYNPLGALSHSNVSTVVVRDASTLDVLTSGVDYAIERINGYVGLQTAGADRPVLVDFHWSQCRYDLICVNAETRAVTIINGTERRRDAGEFLPQANSPTLIPVCYVRVADGFESVIVPLWYLDGGIHRELAVTRRQDYENQRVALAPVIDMARRGETIRIAAMGDSIGSQSGGGTPSSTAPNGPYRDRPEYFNMNIGSDVVGAIPLYDNGAGAGQVHTRTTHIWDIVRAFQELGATVEYYNFCIGGKNSGPGTGNGGDPALRAAVWSVNPHLLVTQYGMNETGNANTEAWLTDLFTEAKANDIPCVLGLGMPRPGAIKGVPMSNILYTNRQIRRAAEYYTVDGERRGAYFATERIMMDEYIGAMGIAPAEFGGADKFHHPGLHEYRTYGRELKRMIKGN